MSQSPSPSVPQSPGSDQIISHKKPLRIRSQQSEKRRNALKEYYKLKEQQQKLEEKAAAVPGPTLSEIATEDDEDDLEKEIAENRPIAEIDLTKAEFKEVLIQTNRLSTSINLINSSIKNIIYNNYYELIKLNDFLNDLNELNLSKLVEQQKEDKKNVLDFLKRPDIAQNDKALPAPPSTASQGLDNLREMMKKIEVLDKRDYVKGKKGAAVDGPAEKTIAGISTLLTLQDTLDVQLEEEYKTKLNTKLTQWITDLKAKGGEHGLVRQLEDVKRSLQPTSA